MQQVFIVSNNVHKLAEYEIRIMFTRTGHQRAFLYVAGARNIGAPSHLFNLHSQMRLS